MKNTFFISLEIIGEGNGNPLQYSCLENAMDGGAWWATVHWVAKSQTHLKWVSTHPRTGDWVSYTCMYILSVLDFLPIQVTKEHWAEFPDPYSRFSSKVKSLSHVRLFVTPWTAAHQAHPSMGFSRQEYWSGVPLPSPTTLLLITKYLSLK